MNKIKRTIIATMAVVCALSSTAAISANAKTLAESFSGSSELVCVSVDIFGNCTWAKKATAKTVGYTGQHYVRAYVGGTDSSAENAIADSGRKYSNGNVTATAQGGKYTGNALEARLAIPTAHSKYGL